MKKLTMFSMAGLTTAGLLVLWGQVTSAQERRNPLKPNFPGYVSPDAKKAAGPGLTKWEYKFVQNASEEACNNLGDEGWEMVGYSVHGQPNVAMKYMAFKRPKR